MIEFIKDQSELISIIIYQEFISEGVKFFTEKDSNFQVGYMNRPNKYIVKPHRHKQTKRIVHKTSEVLFLKKGRLQVQIYNNENILIKTKTLKSGDTIVFLDGGHGIEFLEDSEILEIKQGPYLPNEVKIYL